MPHKKKSGKKLIWTVGPDSLEIKTVWGERADGAPVRPLIEEKYETNPKGLKGELLDFLVLSEAEEINSSIFDRVIYTRSDS